MITLISLLNVVSFLFILGVVTVTVQKNISGGLISASMTQSVTDNVGVLANPNVPAAQPGVLTTHTTNTTGTMTMTNSNHGITTGQRIDIYWTDGQCYGAVAGTVSGTSVPIASVSGGSNLPASSTAVVVGIATSAPFNLTGNNLQALILAATSASGYFVINDGSSDDFAAFVSAGFVYAWIKGDVAANPLATYTPTTVFISHNSIAGAVPGMQAAAVTH